MTRFYFSLIALALFLTCVSSTPVSVTSSTTTRLDDGQKSVKTFYGKPSPGRGGDDDDDDDDCDDDDHGCRKFPRKPFPRTRPAPRTKPVPRPKPITIPPIKPFPHGPAPGGRRRRRRRGSKGGSSSGSSDSDGDFSSDSDGRGGDGSDSDSDDDTGGFPKHPY